MRILSIHKKLSMERFQEFELHYKFNGIKKTAVVNVMHVPNMFAKGFPLVRVCLTPHSKNPDLLLYYQLNNNPEFFSYQLPLHTHQIQLISGNISVMDESISEVIEEALIRKMQDLDFR